MSEWRVEWCDFTSAANYPPHRPTAPPPRACLFLGTRARTCSAVASHGVPEINLEYVQNSQLRAGFALGWVTSLNSTNPQAFIHYQNLSKARRRRSESSCFLGLFLPFPRHALTNSLRRHPSHHTGKQESWSSCGVFCQGLSLH